LIYSKGFLLYEVGASTPGSSWLTRPQNCVDGFADGAPGLHLTAPAGASRCSAGNCSLLHRLLCQCLDGCETVGPLEGDALGMEQIIDPGTLRAGGIAPCAGQFLLGPVSVNPNPGEQPRRFLPTYPPRKGREDVLHFSASAIIEPLPARRDPLALRSITALIYSTLSTGVLSRPRGTTGKSLE